MAAWPLIARAQPAERVRRIGVLLPSAGKSRVSALGRGLPAGTVAIGLELGRNVRIDTRWAATNADIRRQAAEFVALAPDVILAHGSITVGQLLQATHTVPIVFPVIVDPIAGGFVDNMARPGGNATGFMLFENSISGKWLELLTQIAPGVTRVAVFVDPTLPTGPAQFSAIQTMAPSLRVEVTPINMRDAGESSEPSRPSRASNGGLIVTTGAATHNRNLIISRLQHGTSCPRSTSIATSSPPAGCSPMGLIDRHVPARGRLRRSHPQGREASRHASASADEVSACHQPQDR